MTSNHKLLDRLIQSVQLLAANYETQKEVLPDFVVIADEVALTFDECLPFVAMLTQEGLLNKNQLAKIKDIETELHQMSKRKELWTDLALKNNQHWEHIRMQAKELLVLLNEQQSSPDLYWSTYVRGR